MPKERKKVLCMDAQRHAEYYGMQQTFDELYAKSKAGEVFNGLMETIDESIKYPVYTEKNGETGDVILAGPTCDSLDIIYEHFKYQLPLSLEIGDRLYWLSTGAYTASYSSIEFNGFPPLKTYYL